MQESKGINCKALFRKNNIQIKIKPTRGKTKYKIRSLTLTSRNCFTLGLRIFDYGILVSQSLD